MLQAGLSFVVLLALAAGFAALRGVGGAAAPLLGVGAVTVFFTWATVAGALPWAGWVFIGLVAAFFAFGLWRRRAEMWQKLKSPGFVLFCLIGLGLLLVLGVRQPVFKMWDEFSFSGLTAKQLVLYDTSYATLTSGLRDTMTELPGPIVFNWFMQFFGNDFSQWQMIWAFDLMVVACALAPLAAVEAKNWRLWVPLAAAGLLAPFFFSVGYATVVLTTFPYLSVYRDIPAGMMLGAVLALYFAQRHAGKGATWQVALPLAAFSLMKENTLPLVLLAVGIMAADTLFFGTKGWLGEGAAACLGRMGQKTGLARLPGWVKTVVGRLGAAAFWLVAVGAAYLPWTRHAAAAAKLNPNYTSSGGQTNMSTLAAAVQTFKELFGLVPRSPEMAAVLEEFGNMFLGRVPTAGYAPGTYKVSMLGSPLVTVLFMVALTAVVVGLLGTKRRVLRGALAGFLMAAGCAAYHFVLITFWGVFSHDKGSVADYERYIASCLVGWFLLVLAGLAIAATRRRSARGENPVKPALARAAALGVALLMAVRFATLVRPGYSALDFAESHYTVENGRMAAAQQVVEKVPAGQRVFFVRQGGEYGLEWYAYHFYLLPVVLDQSINAGGDFVPPSDEAPWGVTAAEIKAYLDEKELDYIFIDALNDSFVQNYGGLFSDGLAGWAGAPMLYARGADGLFAPA